MNAWAVSHPSTGTDGAKTQCTPEWETLNSAVRRLDQRKLISSDVIWALNAPHSREALLGGNRTLVVEPHSFTIEMIKLL